MQDGNEKRNLNWNDFRFALAVARTGTLTAAAAALQTTPARVGRRVDALEQSIGARLFRRGADGYETTPEGVEVLRRLESVEAAVVSAGLAEEALTVRASLRIVANDLLLAEILASVMPLITADQPSLRIFLSAELKYVDMWRGEADIALRIGRAGTDVSWARRLADVAHCVYRPRGRPDIDDFASFAPFHDDVPVVRYVTDHGIKPRYEVDTLSALVALVRSGAARTVLPCFIGDRDAQIERDPEAPRPPSQDLWLIISPQAAMDQRVKKVADLIGERLEASRPLLEGEVTPPSPG